MGNVYTQNMFQKNETKIILSEEVAVRLLGLINLTGYMTGIKKASLKKGFEYGGILYGHVNNEGNIEFDFTNRETNFIEKDGSFEFQSNPNAVEEFLNNIQTDNINCFAHVHTHPYNIYEASRFFSDPDIQYYKTTFNSSIFSKMAGKNVLMLGCLLTCSDDQKPEQDQKDDIAFVCYDNKNEKMIFFPNIYIKTKDNELLECKHLISSIYVRNSDGKIFRKSQIVDKIDNYTKYNIERTNFSCDINDIKKIK